jgi:hypothetical protein
VESFLPLVRLKHSEEFAWGRIEGCARKDKDIPGYTADSPGTTNRRGIQDLYSGSGKNHRHRAITRREGEGVPCGIHQLPIIGCRGKVHIRGKIVFSDVLCMHQV